jgi:hypothetical protein
LDLRSFKATRVGFSSRAKNARRDFPHFCARDEGKNEAEDEE